MSNINSTDGKTPIYDPDIYHRLWYMGDIWLGSGEAEGKYVVKKNDLVYDLNGGAITLYRVVSVDDETFEPTFKEALVNTDNLSETISNSDILFGVNSSSQADTYRIYLDNTTTPYTLCVDQRLQVNGTMTSYAKIFKGGLEGETISKLFDNSGNYISDAIPLEKVAINNHDNYAIKSIPPCKCTHDLADGEVVTVVLYSDDGGIVSKRQLLVENTSFIRRLNTSTKYITHISLDSILLNPYDDRMIDYPINLPVNSFNMIGKVHYSDGSTISLPIDGNKFTLAGLNDFVATIIGQKVNLVLMYTLGKDEVSFNTVVGEHNVITEPYSLKVIDPDDEMSVKLFCYPVWVNENLGYTLRFYMYTQDRSLWYDVTDYVNFSDQTGEVDGTLYGYRQQKTVYVNMKDVSDSYKPYIHVQNIDVVLMRKPNGRETMWKVKSDTNTGKYFFDMVAIKSSDINTGVWYVNIKNNKETVKEWLDAIYGIQEPMFNEAIENTYPEPTHFYLTVDDEIRKYEVQKDWDKNLELIHEPTLYSNVKIRFTRELGGNVLHLALVEIPVVE